MITGLFSLCGITAEDHFRYSRNVTLGASFYVVTLYFLISGKGGGTASKLHIKNSFKFPTQLIEAKKKERRPPSAMVNPSKSQLYSSKDTLK